MSEASKTKKKNLPRYRGHSRLLKAGNSGSLSVPSEMMGVLPENLLFKPEFTKDGILFRLVDESKMAVEDKTVPAWIKKVATPSPSSTKVEDAVSEPEADDEPEFDSDNTDANPDAEEGDSEPPTDGDDSPF